MSQQSSPSRVVEYVPRSDLVLPINQLSRPKGVKYLCEICGKPAKLMATECPAYYCSYEHFDIDWRGVKSLIAQDLVYIKQEKGEEEGKKGESKAIRKELLELCTETAQKFLVQGKYDLAVPGALQSLKFAIEIFGSESVELVASYLLLAEANLGLRRLKVAEEFLSLANWNLLKDGGENKLMSHLQRNFGRLYAAQQRYSESISAFAIDIYYSGIMYGPEHIRTAPSYFHMGRVFQSYQKKQDRAESFYSKVVENCVGYLEGDSGGGGEEGGTPDSGMGPLTVVEAEEVLEIVKHIEEYRSKKATTDSEPTAWAKGILEAQYCLALLSLFLKDYTGARSYLSAVTSSTLNLSCVHKAKRLLDTRPEMLQITG
mmetsp:Transcript_23238/g.58724  ORF Transcript_23238/g.58724 Transcript_23238/m.58724 type:complete len:373 (-) Transcript_23238:203-1321(-)|eukprot:CAMPEP_0179000574 /NCGR_PEP_ID=MMETSP0795-20121207/10767_1 /TAXON_ID=88552 /ORGANISM="Amoebophrya sp., Strain Ameob2" /LENGTH=372 /DNA_ID=CAMNT_0020693625 /DNA_START=417 /DNA_END=1535 /DNA_ORIENTATION=-